MIVSGAPGLDNLHDVEILDQEQLQKKISVHWDRPPLLVTYHPVTRELEKTEWQVSELLGSLSIIDLPIIFTYPNTDVHGRLILDMLKHFVRTNPKAHLVDNLGTQLYFSLMANSCAMVGNSSSGLIEAPSFKLPVVNIGSRQAGRVRGGNVIDVDYERNSISYGIQRAISGKFSKSLEAMENPYGNGHAAHLIVDNLKLLGCEQNILMKRFVDN